MKILDYLKTLLPEKIQVLFDLDKFNADRFFEDLHRYGLNAIQHLPEDKQVNVFKVYLATCF